MGQYFVYSGFVGPDNYDCSEGPIYTVNEFVSKEDVLSYLQEFNEATDNVECSNLIFRVFEGVERKIQPTKKVLVVEYGLI